MQNLNELIEFFDRISLEESLYFVVSDTYRRATYEFHWRRKSSEQAWQVRLVGHNNWHYFNTQNVIQFVHNEQIDVAQMSRELATALLSQAVFARTLLKGVEDLLGKEKVDEAERQTQTFVEQLRNMAIASVPALAHGADLGAAMQPQNTRKLRVVKENIDGQDQ